MVLWLKMRRNLLIYTQHSGENKKYQNFLFYFSTKCHLSILLWCIIWNNISTYLLTTAKCFDKFVILVTYPIFILPLFLQIPKYLNFEGKKIKTTTKNTKTAKILMFTVSYAGRGKQNEGGSNECARSPGKFFKIVESTGRDPLALTNLWYEDMLQKLSLAKPCPLQTLGLTKKQFQTFPTVFPLIW